MLVDAFPGYNEIQLAEFRIEYLKDLTDFVVIAESKLTHSGRLKPLLFSKWIETKSPNYRSKIIILEIDLTPFRDSWSREVATRETLYKFIEKQFPNSHFILSDLDEIPSLEQIRIGTKDTNTYHFLSPTTFGYANWRLRDPVHSNWSNGVIGHSSVFPGKNGGRYIEFPKLIQSPGLHFSWAFHDKRRTVEKAEATAHTELIDNPAMNKLLIDFAESHGIDHLGRFRQPGFGILEVMAEDKMTTVQLALLNKAPHFFKFELEHPNILSRWLASAACTALWNSSRYQFFTIQVILKKSRSAIHIIFFLLCISIQILMGVIFWARRKIGRVIRYLIQK